MKEVNEMLAFSTPIWSTKYPEHVEQINKLCDPYIKNKRQQNLKENKKNKKLPKKFRTDFGLVHHSPTLSQDSQFKFFVDIVTELSSKFMNDSGFDLTGQKGLLTELWVQEFSKLGGGHHSLHAHWNTHVSGFYFLKCSKLTSFPKFQDPRPGALMTKIVEKDFATITPSNSEINYSVKPGDMIIFPGYLPHQFAVDYGVEPFRFIHWNIQYVKF